MYQDSVEQSSTSPRVLTPTPKKQTFLQLYENVKTPVDNKLDSVENNVDDLLKLVQQYGDQKISEDEFLSKAKEFHRMLPKNDNSFDVSYTFKTKI